MLYKGNWIETVHGTYRLAEGYGPYMNKRWEVQKKNEYAKDDWTVDFHGSKELCEEALRFRIEHAQELKEHDEEIRKATWAFALEM